MNANLKQFEQSTRPKGNTFLSGNSPTDFVLDLEIGGNQIGRNIATSGSVELNCSGSTKSNLASLLDEMAARNPDCAALIQGSGPRCNSISYQNLSKLVQNKAGALRAGGLRKGDLVLMLQPMSIDLYPSILAVFRLGATVLVVDAAAGKEKVSHAVACTKPRAVIAAGKGILAAVAIKSVRGIKLKFSDGPTLPGWHSLPSKVGFASERSFSLAPSNNAPLRIDSRHVQKMDGAETNNRVAGATAVTRTTRCVTDSSIEPVDASHPALITLTSGTSGKSKMIVRSHEFLRTQLQAVSSNCDVIEGTCELTSLPVFVLANLASSVTTILPDANLANLKSMRIERVIDQLRRFQPERILGSPAFIERIVSECANQRIVLPFIKTIITGGGPVFPRLLQHTQAVCANADVFTVYGSSEAEPISKINCEELTKADLNAIANGAGLPVGFPVNQIRIRVEPLVEQNDQLNNAERLATLRHICELANLSLNAVGEILVTGDHVVKGYDRGIGDEETKVQINNVIWHRTGDVGYFDRHGRLWLTGRLNNKARETNKLQNAKSDYLDSSFALSVEAAALFDPNVERAACVTLNNVTTLFIESTIEIDAWTLKNRLGWCQLSAVRLVRKIPMDTRHSSKVLYQNLARSA